jgi:hypothetical protein
VGRAIFCLRQAACLSRSLCRANRKPCMLSVLGRYAASSSYQLQIAVSSSLVGEPEHEKGDELLQDTPAPARTTVVHAISFLCSNSEGQVTTTSGWRVRSFLLCRHSRARLFVHGPRIASHRACFAACIAQVLISWNFATGSGRRTTPPRIS